MSARRGFAWLAAWGIAAAAHAGVFAGIGIDAGARIQRGAGAPVIVLGGPAASAGGAQRKAEPVKAPVPEPISDEPGTLPQPVEVPKETAPLPQPVEIPKETVTQKPPAAVPSPPPPIPAVSVKPSRPTERAKPVRAKRNTRKRVARLHRKQSKRVTSAGDTPARKGSRTARLAPRRTMRPGDGGRGAGRGRALRANYQGRVLAHLKRHKRHPGRIRGRTGTASARLRFTIDRKGRVTARRLTRSTGHARLDAEVNAMIRRANPFPPIPPALGKSAMSFTVPISFKLR